ncbi:MAG: DUF421 domain-containing protein [Euryarchaeota archaeon]|nr:DUF421 domain-containing protein [Euryarchaeota archaeon]
MFHDQVAEYLDVFPLDRSLVILLNAFIVYSAALLILRLGKNRFLGKNTAFDVVLGFILGSTLSRAVNGDAPILASIVAAALLVIIHYIIAVVTYRSDGMGRLIKGSPEALVLDGEIIWENMDRHKIGRRDLEESMRVRGQVVQVEDIKVAFFERNGKISIVPSWEYRRHNDDDSTSSKPPELQKAEAAAEAAEQGPPGKRSSEEGGGGGRDRRWRDEEPSRPSGRKDPDGPKGAHILDVEVAEGVQKVRIELM